MFEKMDTGQLSLTSPFYLFYSFFIIIETRQTAILAIHVD